ncbi:hypothetical protein [Nonomuraea maritima]|uniref:hypothetical protein n=1 Tax=Nonomuraea maritima TaxID=683260 RepID=UPI000B87C8EC|nr:hypothetical protein [Nonomuraea maritima]
MHDAVVEYAVRPVYATREPERLGVPDVRRLPAFGAGPRATLGPLAAGRAPALIRGRTGSGPRARPDGLRPSCAAATASCPRTYGTWRTT